FGLGASRSPPYQAMADGSWRLRAMGDGSGQRAWHREPGTMSGYGVPVGLGERAGGERCPQCGESDLWPYGNGSKWACPRCYFIVPCCEGVSSPRGARPTWDGERRRRTRGGCAQGRPVPAGGCRLGSRIVTSLVAQVSQLASEAEAPLDTGPHVGVSGWRFAGLRGANWGANGDRYLATPGHFQPVSVQLDGTSGRI